MLSRQYCEIESIQQAKLLFHRNYEQYLLLGGGSNILFRKDYNGLVIRNQLKGFEIQDQTDGYVWVKTHAGENWHELVLKCVSKYYGGVENLSLIQGSVGAATIQNIGAYGVELRDVFHSLEALNVETGVIEKFNADACKFEYRGSIFKHSKKGKYLVLIVTLKLTTKNHKLSTTYGDTNRMLEYAGINNPTIRDISNVVISIRKSKLPDNEKFRNAGSFFKNPVIGKDYYERLKVVFPSIPGFKNGEEVKVSGGWLIEQCGWKGFRRGCIGVHEKHALVLVNYGGSLGQDIYELSQEIQSSVLKTFGIELQREVNVT